MKRYGVFCALLCVMSCMAAEDCQMLLPEAKQKEILGGRRYPQSSRRRISSAAVRDKMFYCRACMHLTKLYEAWDKKELQSKYREKLSAELKKDPSLQKHLQLY